MYQNFFSQGDLDRDRDLDLDVDASIDLGLSSVLLLNNGFLTGDNDLYLPMALQIPLGSTVSLVTSFGSVDCTTDSSFSTFLVTDTIGFSCSTSGSVKHVPRVPPLFSLSSTSLSTFFSPLSSFRLCLT